MEKLKNHSSKILVFVINLLVMAVIFLVIKDKENQKEIAALENTGSTPEDSEIAEKNSSASNDPESYSTNTTNQNDNVSTTLKSKNQNQNNGQTNANKSSANINASANSTNVNKQIDRRTRTS